jgi:hypothetical protein
MKRKEPLKTTKDRETIDPSVLEAVLGAVPVGGGEDRRSAVIAQPSFSSFFHS